jgi:SAM-dependent methyltransferase
VNADRPEDSSHGADPRSVERELTAYYDQEGADRADRPLERHRVDARERFVASFGERRPSLLEVGPGAGRDSAGLVADGFQVVGVDLSFDQLSHAQPRGLLPVMATARTLPFADATFEALWTMSTLMHIPDSAIDAALAELRRVLAPGAVAAIGVWGGPDIEGVGDLGRYGPRLFSRRSDQRWQRLLETVGIVEVFENWHPDTEDFWYQWAVVRRR